MTTSSPLRKVFMVRDHLEGIPQFKLPPGFSIRLYQTGDALTWIRIWQEAERFQPVSSTLFEEQFGTDQTRLAERQLFLCNAEGQAIGTATAWLNPCYRGQSFGRVHYLAILPAFQGKGLGRPLLTAVCNRLVALRHTRAYLSTETIRQTAIHLYLQFGFRPQISNDQDLAVWSELRRQGLAIPSIDTPC